jgi:tRNA dimethylallyltransferase
VYFPYTPIKIALVPSDRARLHVAIEKRFDLMLEAGLVAEVRRLRDEYSLDSTMPAMRCVGYRQAWQFAEGQLSAEELRDHGIAATRQLAKRQLTWLRAMTDVTVFDTPDDRLDVRVLEYVRRELEVVRREV